MTTLVQEIEERLAGAKVDSVWQSVGVVREIGDGVARVEGLREVMLNEMLDLGHGVPRKQRASRFPWRCPHA